MHRRRILVLAVSAAVGGLSWWAAAPGGSQDGSAPPPGFSLLAVGDTGKPRELVAALDPGLAVAAALAHADRESPVTGLVLLGDNFYPDGLREREFKDRVRSNLVGPFCHFIRLTPRGQGSLEDACPAREADRHPVPIHAVLGNHDYNERESPLLQRRRIPEYVENWRMPLGDFEIRELRGGVSLILLDSMAWLRGEQGDALTRAVRKSRGPWRIVAAHHPMVDTGKSAVPRFERRMAKALDRAGVPIHLFLAGHEHNLQVIERPGDWPRLHVIAGSGSDLREPARGDAGRRFALAEHGFARIDLTEGGPLRITLQRVPVVSAGAASGEDVARFSIDLDGTVSDLRSARD
jgi:hypothetical protein